MVNDHIDVNQVAAMMCYLQLSLLNIPAEVVTGNTLTMEHSRVMRTPAYYLGFWGSKLRRRWSSEETQEVELNEVAPMVSPQSVVTMTAEQMSLFDVVA